MTAIDPAEAEDLHCPVCDYSLRALPEPRCPECGYAFEWAELAEQARRKKLWFYEHAGTFKSHLQTRWKSFWLFPFWREIHAYSDANRDRLSTYRFVTGALAGISILFSPILIELVFFLNEYVRMCIKRASYGSPGSTSITYYVPPPRPSFLSFLERWWEWSGNWFREFGDQERVMIRYELGMAVLVLLVTIGSSLYWKILSTSMRMAGARPIHLSRINTYVGDVLPISVVMLALMFCLRMSSSYGFGSSPSFYLRPITEVNELMIVAVVTPGIVFLPLAFRFGWALHRYLRLRHSMGVAVGYWLLAVLTYAVVISQGFR
ncbi:MAG: hypothetical protein JWM57_1940 [Phycisphaerales bacterium]|nr:hypothetical protein [Phycisphaerales bacterium]